MKCINCQTETLNPKFCSNSCAASFNNKGIRRHGKPKGICKMCQQPKSSHTRTYCSRACSAADTTKRVSLEHTKKMNALRQSRYRAKKYRVLAEDANHDKIKEIYMNCPKGHEVDHVIPLSKGGLHHENNLQYLTVLENRQKGNKLL